jgi:hypothetical protein
MVLIQPEKVDIEPVGCVPKARLNPQSFNCLLSSISTRVNANCLDVFFPILKNVNVLKKENFDVLVHKIRKGLLTGMLAACCPIPQGAMG